MPEEAVLVLHLPPVALVHNHLVTLHKPTTRECWRAVLNHRCICRTGVGSHD